MAVAGASAFLALVITWTDRGAAPVMLAILAALALVVLVALSLARYEAAVGLGFVILGVVVVEPAPPDAVFAIVIAVGLVTGRLAAGGFPS